MGRSMAGGESRETFTQNSTRENVKTCQTCQKSLPKAFEPVPFCLMTQTQIVVETMTEEQAEEKLIEFDLMPFGPFMSCSRCLSHRSSGSPPPSFVPSSSDGLVDWQPESLPSSQASWAQSARVSFLIRTSFCNPSRGSNAHFIIRLIQGILIAFPGLGKRKSSIAWQNIVQASVRLCHTENLKCMPKFVHSLVI